MGFARYLKYSLWDLLLCACASSALTFVLCTGFDSTRPLQEPPLLFVMVLACTLLSLFITCIAYCLPSAVIGGVALALGTALTMMGLWTASGAASLLDDTPGNYTSFALMAVLCAVLVHVLSRRRATTLVLLAGGTLLCAVIEYLYFLGHLLPTLLFMVAGAALYAYRNYQGNLLGSETERISFGSATAAGLVIAVVAVGVGAGLFTLCIAPLNPPNVIVKLLTEHVRVDEENVRGIGDSVSVQNDQLYSNNVLGQIPGKAGEQGDTEQTPNMDDTRQTEDAETTPNAGSALGLAQEGEPDAGQPVSAEAPDWLPLACVLALVGAVVLLVAMRKLLRWRAWGKLGLLSPRQQVGARYLFFMRRFKRLKLPQPGTQTLSEYLLSANGSLRRFEQTTETPAFNRLTSAYCAVVYGNAEPSESTMRTFEEYHRSFYRNARKLAGPLKYLWLFFRL